MRVLLDASLLPDVEYAEEDVDEAGEEAEMSAQLAGIDLTSDGQSQPDDESQRR